MGILVGHDMDTKVDLGILGTNERMYERSE